MSRKGEMISERDFENFNGETHGFTSNVYPHHNNHHSMLNGVASSSSCYSRNGFGVSDVGPSSSSSFDHSQLFSPKIHVVDQCLLGPSLSDYYGRKPNNGFMMDEVGLSREFHRISIGDLPDNSPDMGRFRRDPDGFGFTDYSNVPKIKTSHDDNFEFSGGFVNGFSGNGGFPDRNFNQDMNLPLEQTGFNVTPNSLESISAHNQSYVPYTERLGHQNCLINVPLEDAALQRADSYGGIGLPVMRGNKGYEYDNGVSLHRSNSSLGNGVPARRVNEHVGNVGLVQRGNGVRGHGDAIPLHVQSMYGPHVGGDPLQQCMMDRYKEAVNPWDCSQNFSPLCNPYSNEALLQQANGQFCGNVGGLNSMDIAHLIYAKQALGIGNGHYNLTRERLRAAEDRQLPPSMKKLRQQKAYGCESSFLLKEKGLNGAGGRSSRAKNSLPGSIMLKVAERNGQLQSGNCSHLTTCDPVILQSICGSLEEAKGNIPLLAKDQHGCRFLQKKFEEGSFDDVQLIFSEIIDHVVELMMNPFGNYLIQKLLDVCNEEQRMKIVLVLTKERGELVKISLNTHGTRVVQKLIERLSTRKQISLVIRALEPGFLDLIQDLNGNHVVQRCLQCLSSEENKFIYDAAAEHCVKIATHRHGCCVLQRCIAHSSGEQRKKLVQEICRNGLRLAQDPFGNYVVQYIIEQKIPSASAQLISQFEGHYVHLSTQKFSSHVVEKCLKFIEDSQQKIVCELLSVSHFEQLLQDPFANYVIQSALEVTKSPLNGLLAAAVKPHSILRTNPYCKKIFTRGLFKK